MNPPYPMPMSTSFNHPVLSPFLSTNIVITIPLMPWPISKLTLSRAVLQPPTKEFINKNK